MSVEWVCADALEWLPARVGACGAVATSPPDAGELGMAVADYRPWLEMVAALCIAATSQGRPTTFYVTDRKAGGTWHSKAGLLMRVAAETGRYIVWHKIALRRAPGVPDLHRPTYSHLLCFGDEDVRPGAATADVIVRGPVLYPNGTGAAAAAVAVAHAALSGPDLTDPFCGYGTIPRAADAIGMDAIGVDIDPAMIGRARLRQEGMVV